MRLTRMIGALLVCTASLSAATGAPDDLRPSRHFALSDPPPPPLPDKDHWPDGDDLVSFFDESTVGHWIAQANAGRARAAKNAGDLLRVWAKADGSCDDARKWYRKAEELGSDAGAASIGMSYASSDCPDQNPAAALPWLRKGVDVGSFGAARRLAELLSDPQSVLYDAAEAFTYARVQSESKDKLEGEPPDLAALRDALMPEQRTVAEARADEILRRIRSREAAFAPVPPEAVLASRETVDWTASIIAVDDLRECERNLIGNCLGVRRLAYAEVTNKTGEFLQCRLTLATVHGKTDKEITLRRDAIVAPHAARRLRVGRISGAPDRAAFQFDCSPVEGLAARVALGECRTRLTASIDGDKIYPAESRRRDETGRVILYVLAPAPESVPLHAEIEYSSTFPALDAAALNATRELSFRSDCADGIGFTRFAVDFRLE